MLSLRAEFIAEDRAAALYRTCRRNGETVRKFIDCLIAAVSRRANAPVLHANADLSALAPAHTAGDTRRISQVANRPQPAGDIAPHYLAHPRVHDPCRASRPRAGIATPASRISPVSPAGR